MYNELAVKAPPVSFEAEQALLGTVLHKPDILSEISATVLPEDFAQPAHGEIFGAMLALQRHGRPVTVTALRPVCAQIDALADVGFADYLQVLIDSVTTTLNGPEYARQVHELAARRMAFDVAYSFLNRISDASEVSTNLGEVIASFDMDLSRLAKHAGTPSAKLIGAEAERELRRLEAIRAGEADNWQIPTGFVDLDKKIGGLIPGELWTAAGRTGMGKSAFALTIADHVASRGQQVCYISREMSRRQLRIRLAAARAHVDVAEAVNPKGIPDHDYYRLQGAIREVEGLPIHVSERAANIPQVRAMLAQLQRKKGLDLVIVDYIGLLRGESRQSEANRAREVAEITRGLKEIALSMRVPVLALHQINRGVEGRENKRPGLADLKDSGSVEEDSDKVLMLYRPAYYADENDPDGQADARLCEVIIAKNRMGPGGTVPLDWDAKSARFGNRAQDRML